MGRSDRAPAPVAQKFAYSAAPTMKDIAAAAGVSQSTVSRVLSGTPFLVPIASTTKDRVLAVARDLGFRPNPLAQALRGARTMLLGVIVGDITDPFYAGVIEAISVAARGNAYNVVLGHAHGRPNEAIELRAVLETRHCDAIILLGDMSGQPGMVAELGEARVPTVSLGRGVRHDDGMPSVDVDNQHGIFAAMDYLVTLGHERIAHIGGPPIGDFPARRAAYLDFMSRHGLRVRRRYNPRTTNDACGGSSAMQALLALPVPPTAVIAATDLVAIGAMHAAHLAGVQVPNDISVIGFDDLPIAAYTVPALTTVHMPIVEMAAIAVREAIVQVRGVSTDFEAKAFVPEPNLVIRDSCSSPPATAGEESAVLDQSPRQQ
jgi:DNA-binding LacI/PurR family transcriptional regulator